MAGGWRRTRQDTAVWADARAPASASVSCACSGGSAPPSSSHCKVDRVYRVECLKVLTMLWSGRQPHMLQQACCGIAGGWTQRCRAWRPAGNIARQDPAGNRPSQCHCHHCRHTSMPKYSSPPPPCRNPNQTAATDTVGLLLAPLSELSTCCVGALFWAQAPSTAAALERTPASASDSSASSVGSPPTPRRSLQGEGGKTGSQEVPEARVCALPVGSQYGSEFRVERSGRPWTRTAPPSLQLWSGLGYEQRCPRQRATKQTA